MSGNQLKGAFGQNSPIDDDATNHKNKVDKKPTKKPSKDKTMKLSKAEVMASMK